MDGDESERPVGWIQQLRRRKLQHLVGTVMTDTSAVPEFITSFNNISKKKKTLRVLFYTLLVINLAVCVYQTVERILHYMDEPTTVDAHLIETTHGLFPYVYIIPIETEDYFKTRSTTCVPPRRNNCLERCDALYQLPGQSMYNFTDILKYLSNLSYLTDAYFKMGKLRVNLKIKSYDSIMQPTAQVSSELRIPYGNYNYKMVIKVNFPSHCRQYYGLIDHSPIKYHTHFDDVLYMSKNTDLRYKRPNKAIWDRYNKTYQATIILQKYHFTNTKKNPCNDKLNNCLRRCLLKNITCRYPFYEARNLPECNDTHLKKEFIRWRLFFRVTSDLIDHCKCLNLCEVTRQTLTYGQILDSKPGIDVYVANNHIRTLKENLSYNIISLLCDIGGNIGLYFGMSCLTLVEIFIHYCKPLLIKNGRTSLKIKNKIQTLQAKLEKPETKKKNKSKFFIFLCLGFLSGYQVYNYVCSYFDYPLTKTISLVKDKIIQFPLIITCHHQHEISAQRKAAADYLKMDCDRIQFLDLLHGSTKYKSPLELWKDSSNLLGYYRHVDKWQKYDNTHRVFKSVNLSQLSTPFGICTVFKKYDMPYYPNKNNIEFSNSFDNHRYNYGCRISVDHPNFIVPQNQLFHPKHIFYIFDQRKMHIDMMRQTLIQVNTPKTPCEVANNLVVECEEKCYKSKIKQQKFHCRLPFMENTTLPFCMTPETAKRTQKTYLEIQFKTDPQKHCCCLARCKETIYLPTLIDLETLANNIEIKYSIGNNIREVIEDQRQLTIVKLLCQIGSIIGILTGLSIYAVVQYFI